MRAMNKMHSVLKAIGCKYTAVYVRIQEQAAKLKFNNHHVLSHHSLEHRSHVIVRPSEKGMAHMVLIQNITT